MKKALLYSFLVIYSCSDLPITDFVEPTEINLQAKNKVNLNNLNNGYLLRPFSSFDYLGNNPNKASRSYVDGVQGLANDGTNWFLSNKEQIYKWGGSYGFPSTLPASSIDVGMVIGGGYDHYGDIDYDEDQDLLYVPLEKKNKSKEPLLVVMNSNLAFIDSGVLSENAKPQYNNEAPWVSIHPITKEIYSSKFDEDVTELWVYEDVDTSSSLNLLYRKAIALKKPNGSSLVLNRIQGGEFSKSGHLFILSEEGPDGEGIYTFDCSSASQCKLVNYEFMQIDQNYGQEFEGITIWDFDNTSGNGGYGGQVHAITWQPFRLGVGYKKFWLKHFRMGLQSTEVITPKIIGYTVNGKPHLEWDDFGVGYTYEVYENNTSPNGGGLNLIASTSSNSITLNTLLENPSYVGSYANIYYYVIAKKNGLRSSISNTIQFSIEYDASGGGLGCGHYIICPGEFE